MNVEAAAWITQLKSLLAMSFYLASLLLFLRSETEPSPRRSYVAAVVLFLAAMLSKPSVVMMPVVILLIAWYCRGRISKRDALRSLPFFAISGFLSVVEIWFQYTRSIAETVVRTDGFAARLAGAGQAVWFYLSKALFPADLMFVYPRRELDPSAPLSWLPLAALLALTALLWAKRAAWGRGPIFALAYFAVTLLPVLGFLNIFYMRYSFVADHWQYQSIIGALALVAGTAVHFGRGRFARFPGLLPTVAAAATLLLAAVSIGHQRTYWSVERLWEETLKRNPQAWIAHQCLGEHLSRQGRLDEAVAHFTAELAIKPDFAEPHYNLGIARAAQGRIPEALAHYDEAVRLDPKNAEAHNNAGVLLTSLGRYDEAAARFQKSLAARPAFADAHINWGLALAAQKRYAEAESRYADAVATDPSRAEAWTNWGAALLAQGKSAAAVERLSKALELDGGSPSAHLNLARGLAASGRLEDAILRAREALRLDPDYPAARQSIQAWSQRAP